MKSKRLRYSAALLIAVIGGLFLWHRSSGTPGKQDASQQAATARAAAPATIHAAARPDAKSPAVKPPAELSEEERDKNIDREHMKKLREGIFAYKAKYGNYPEYLSQLAPEFVPAETLVSPRRKENRGGSILASDHPDPGVEEPSYGYEFSNLEFSDGRTFAEIKEVQRAEWGDAVPLLRFFGYDKVINMAWGGEIYETQLNWEWDAATLDVVDKLGWGPGLDTGDMVKVKVLRPDGSPVSGAKVWADGRNYSFDLPERPFVTDAQGYAQIPVGVDQDRTALALRLEASGFTAPLLRFAAGDSLPQETTLTAGTEAQTVGGQVLDASGAPVANTRIFLRPPSEENFSDSGNLAQLRTDSEGRWQAVLNPQDAASFTVTVAVPGGKPFKYSGGLPVDPAAAAAGNAVIIAPGQR